MIKPIINIYQEEIRYLDLYYSSESAINYLEDLEWIEGVIERMSLSQEVIDKQTLVSIEKIKSVTIKRIQTCMLNDVSNEKELLLSYVNELQSMKYNAVV